MPLSDVHKKRRQKNLIVLGMIVGWVALVWAISFLKIAQGG